MPHSSVPRAARDDQKRLDAVEEQVERAAGESAPKRRRAYLPASERRRQIILAAQEVFARSSLQGARTRDIAKAAEVNQATLFEHFDSKEALFHEAVIQPLLEAMRGMSDRAQSYEAAASVEELRSIAHRPTQQNLEVITSVFPLFTAALFSDLEMGRAIYMEQIVPLLRERAEAMSGFVKDTLDPHIVELAIFGTFFAIAMDESFRGEKRDHSAVAEQITNLMASGFAKELGKN